MKNKKLIATIVGAVLALLGAFKVYLDTPEAAPRAPAPISADAGV